MHFVYCANCGKKISIGKKALPRYATIIDVIEPHECGETVEELHLVEVDIPPFDFTKSKGKFVQKLNDLSQPRRPAMPMPELRDKRFDKGPTTTAPSGVREMIDNMMPVTPEAGPPESEEGDDE